MLKLVWLIPVLPLVGFLFNFLLGRRLRLNERTTITVQAIKPDFVGFDTTIFDTVDGRHYPGIALGRELTDAGADRFSAAAAADINPIGAGVAACRRRKNAGKFF